MPGCRGSRAHRRASYTARRRGQARRCVFVGGPLVSARDAENARVLNAQVCVHRQDDTCESISTPGLYPCGEGAGYAGGIVSAAVDGLRVGEAVAAALISD